jgi:hypothetical protein
MAEPVLRIVSPFADMIGYLVSSREILSAIGGLFAGMKVFQIWNLAAKQRELAVEAEILALKTGQATASAIISPWAIVAGVAAAAIAGGLIYSSMKPKKVGDMQYDNKTGKTTISTKEGGLYSISDNDQINVHPELKPSNNRITPPTPNTSMNNDAFLAKLEKYLSKLDNLEKMQDRPVVVHSTVQLPNGEVLARSTNETNRKTHYGVQ